MNFSELSTTKKIKLAAAMTDVQLQSAHYPFSKTLDGVGISDEIDALKKHGINFHNSMVSDTDRMYITLPPNKDDDKRKKPITPFGYPLHNGSVCIYENNEGQTLISIENVALDVSDNQLLDRFGIFSSIMIENDVKQSLTNLKEMVDKMGVVLPGIVTTIGEVVTKLLAGYDAASSLPEDALTLFKNTSKNKTLYSDLVANIVNNNIAYDDDTGEPINLPKIIIERSLYNGMTVLNCDKNTVLYSKHSLQFDYSEPPTSENGILSVYVGFNRDRKILLGTTEISNCATSVEFASKLVDGINIAVDAGDFSENIGNLAEYATQMIKDVAPFLDAGVKARY